MTNARPTRPRRERSANAPSGVETALLVRTAQAGDAEALICLVAAHRPTLLRFCLRLMGDAPAGEDLAQEALLRAQLSIARLGPPYRFGPWLLGIAANLAKKAWRAEARRPISWETLAAAYPNVAWNESLTTTPSPEGHSEAAEEARLLSDAISALPRSLSEVLVMHYLDGLSYAEVADALALPVSTVKGHLYESRSRLRRSLVACGVREAATVPPSASPTASQYQPHPQPERNPVSQTSPSTPNRIGIGNHLRVEVDVDAITREAERFLSERWPRPRPREALDELASPRNRFLSTEVLESMVLDGASTRQHVQPFVEHCLAEWGLTEHTDPALAALTEKLRSRGLR